MRYKLLIGPGYFLALIAWPLLSCKEQPSRYTDYVDLFTGTAGDHGQLDPAACVPFGMVKLGPDTDPVHHSGYHYKAKSILGFSHNRIGGVGCRGAGGNVRIKPGIGKPGDQSEPYIKTTEKASTGYYAVTLGSGIKAEMTAANQVGFHRYTFPQSDSAYLMIDPKSSFAAVLEHKILKATTDEITGYVRAKNVCDQGAYTTYFVIRSNKNFEEVETREEKLYCLFKTQAEEVIELKVILSPISVDQAQKDFQALYEGVTFQQARQKAERAWETMLSRIETEGNEEYKKLFYTSLYRALLTPVNTTSSVSTFKGTDGKIHHAEGYVHHDSWSMWDTFRTKFPLIALIYPEMMQHFVRSMENLYQNGKYDWAGPHEPVPTVRTEHSILFLLDAFRKDINVNWEKIYPFLKEEMDSLPYKTPDNVLESSYDKWAMAEIAKQVGRTDDHERYKAESKAYKTTWNKYFKNINDSSDIMHGYGLYEGTIWQYRWHTQFDIAGLIEGLGGKEESKNQLTQFFTEYLYNHGNQPDLHVPFLFNAFGAPELTQYWVNKILTKEMVQHYGTHKKWDEPYIGRIYKAAPEGYIPEMDDDDGTMSAWYVWSAMGLYPLVVGAPVYQMSTPIFDKITLHLKGGKTLVIESKNYAEDSFYIHEAVLNGKPIKTREIDHQAIAGGGNLVYILSNAPRENDLKTKNK